PGKVLMADDAAAAVGAAGAWPGMSPSGMTCCTAGAVFSRASSPADTLAARELTRGEDRMGGACTRRSPPLSGLWEGAIPPARGRGGRGPARTCRGWFLNSTITCWLTCCDNWAARAADSGCMARLVVMARLAAEVAAGAATAGAACVVTRAAADAPARKTEPAVRPARVPSARSIRRRGMLFTIPLPGGQNVPRGG